MALELEQASGRAGLIVFRQSQERTAASGNLLRRVLKPAASGAGIAVTTDAKGNTASC
jgi:hypothetical protein